MQEAFLHYIWKYQLFNFSNLKTTDGDLVEVIKQGIHNQNAGPDFNTAKIQIGETIWAGDVEIHVKSSDWNLHKHSKDKAYDTTILHVVYENDRVIKRSSGEVIPTIELKDRIHKGVNEKYEVLINNQSWIPCANNISKVDGFVINNWIDRLLVERLERKSKPIEDLLELTHNDWEEVAYIFIARSFGLKVNAVPFELLAKSIPLKILSKHKDNLLQIEALLFGQAGFLNQDFTDEYPNQLKKEYQFLRYKYQLTPLESSIFKFLRLRPANFPTIRIAQLARFIQNNAAVFSQVKKVNVLIDVKTIFDITLSGYWNDHYQLDKLSLLKLKTLGRTTIDTIVLNTIAPLLFLYGKKINEEQFQNIALKLLEEIKPEKNAIVEKWYDIGIKAKSAYQTQALLELKNEYCSHKKCLNCNIGNQILRN